MCLYSGFVPSIQIYFSVMLICPPRQFSASWYSIPVYPAHLSNSTICFNHKHFFHYLPHKDFLSPFQRFLHSPCCSASRKHVLLYWRHNSVLFLLKLMYFHWLIPRTTQFIQWYLKFSFCSSPNISYLLSIRSEILMLQYYLILASWGIPTAVYDFKQLKCKILSWVHLLRPIP